MPSAMVLSITRGDSATLLEYSTRIGHILPLRGYQSCLGFDVERIPFNFCTHSGFEHYILIKVVLSGQGQRGPDA